MDWGRDVTNVIMNSLRKTVRTNLRRLRREQGLTQKELSEACGFSRSYVNKIESGERSPSLQTLEHLAAQLGVDPVQLFRQPQPE